MTALRLPTRDKVVHRPRAPRRRLHRLAPARSTTGSRRDLARIGAVLAAAVTVLLVGGWWGLAAAPVAAFAAHRGLCRVEAPAARERRTREEADLAISADLIAAALKAGAPVDVAVAAVAEALDGPLRDRLLPVARSLRLGADADEAWSHVADVAGGARMAAAAVRSASSGAALAGALARLADDLRADRAAGLEAAARRAGVLVVLPLGLCFLPAFILAGLVPVIVAVLGDVL